MAAYRPKPASDGGVSKADISSGELRQRVAVIKRFKELLKAQRDRFNAYLFTLDRQKDVIERGTTDELLRHVELEEKIVADIFSIQKVIDPLEKMYRTAESLSEGSRAFAGKSGSAAGNLKSGGTPSRNPPDGDEIGSLKDALEGLKAEALIRSERNRGLLAKRMAELRSEINSLKNGAYARRRFDNGPAPSLIDLKG